MDNEDLYSIIYRLKCKKCPSKEQCAEENTKCEEFKTLTKCVEDYESEKE